MSDTGTPGSPAPEPGAQPDPVPGTDPGPPPGTEPTVTTPAVPLPGTEPTLTTPAVAPPGADPTATMPAVPPLPPPAAVPSAPPPPPPGTKIQQVQGEGAWRRWMLVAIVVLALVVVGLALWAADRQTPDDEGDTGGEAVTTVAEGTTTVPPTTVAPTTVAPTTEAPTTAAPTTAAPTSAPTTTAPGGSTSSSPATTVAPEFQGVLADLAELPDYSTLTSLLAAAGIYELDEPVTIFAPTNEAFEALPADTVEFLTDPANVDVLTEVLTNHVVKGAFLASDLPTGTTLTTLDGQELEVTSAGGRLLVGGVPVVDADIEGGDGSVIHGIDGVLVPDDVDLPA